MHNQAKPTGKEVEEKPEGDTIKLEVVLAQIPYEVLLTYQQNDWLNLLKSDPENPLLGILKSIGQTRDRTDLQNLYAEGTMPEEKIFYKMAKLPQDSWDKLLAALYEAFPHLSPKYREGLYMYPWLRIPPSSTDYGHPSSED